MAPFRALAKIDQGDERHNKAAAVATLGQIIWERGADGNCTDSAGRWRMGNIATMWVPNCRWMPEDTDLITA
jgi:hypothetical protein